MEEVTVIGYFPNPSCSVLGEVGGDPPITGIVVFREFQNLALPRGTNGEVVVGGALKPPAANLALHGLPPSLNGWAGL
jgi:hypothetical protein